MTDDTYTVRRYERGDREGFRTVFETVFGHAFTDETFEWKFERNPYVSHVPILVAETDGEIVGARGFLGHRVRAGDRTVLGLQATDAMVHPDHRGQGVYGRLVEYTSEYYADREATLRFSFPNRQSLPGNLKHGARLVGTVPTYYRIRKPAALLGANDAPGSRAVDRIGGALARRYLATCERLKPNPDDRVTVERRADPPAEDLGALYERTVPDALHTVRDAAYYRWRFGNPEWEYATYVARRGETVVASVVAGTRRRDGTRVTRLADVLPLGGRTQNRDGALARALEAVISDHRRSDLIAAFGDGIPNALLGTHGFLNDHRLPLSAVSTPTRMVIRPLSPDPSDWSMNGFDVADRGSWLLSYSDWDVS